jgi:hypothetical protein
MALDRRATPLPQEHWNYLANSGQRFVFVGHLANLPELLGKD